VKAEVIRMLKALPDNLTWEHIQYHIYVRKKIERAEEDIKAGRVLFQEEVEAKVRKMVKRWCQRV
jgi:predicted transcriptional regulator